MDIGPTENQYTLKTHTMNKAILTFALAGLTVLSCSQTNIVPTELNLGFEKVSSGQKLPDKWFQWGANYLLSIDTAVKHSGNNSVMIHPSENRTTGSFGCVAYSIPARYKGEEIELKAYLKLQDVSEGTIGLMLRIDGFSGTLQFENM
jgi:hypothetical protein